MEIRGGRTSAGAPQRQMGSQAGPEACRLAAPEGFRFVTTDAALSVVLLACQATSLFRKTCHGVGLGMCI